MANCVFSCEWWCAPPAAAAAGAPTASFASCFPPVRASRPTKLRHHWRGQLENARPVFWCLAACWPLCARHYNLRLELFFVIIALACIIYGVGGCREAFVAKRGGKEWIMDEPGAAAWLICEDGNLMRKLPSEVRSAALPIIYEHHGTLVLVHNLMFKLQRMQSQQILEGFFMAQV